MKSDLPLGFTANGAALFYDAAAYAEMLALLGRAETSVRVSFYLFGGPDAHKMMDILTAKQREGIAVRVLLDRSVGLSGMLPEVIWDCRRAYRRLRSLEIDVCLSSAHPIPDWPGKTRVWHHKYLVVDDREAMVGGMNVGSLFRRYHDLMVRLTGPAAALLGRQFDDDWRLIAGPRYPGLPRPCNGPSRGEDGPGLCPPPGQTWARLLGTGPGRASTETALRQNLRRAQTSVSVAVCEMGRTDLLRDLVACRERGVGVRVLLCPLNVGRFVPPGILNAGAVAELRAAGVAVHLYRLGPDFLRMHQKLALFDDACAVTGSTNWTRSGFGWIGETDVELHGGPVMEELAAGFEADWQRSAPAPPPSPSVLRLYALYERRTQ